MIDTGFPCVLIDTGLAMKHTLRGLTGLYRHLDTIYLYFFFIRFFVLRLLLMTLVFQVLSGSGRFFVQGRQKTGSLLHILCCWLAAKQKERGAPLTTPYVTLQWGKEKKEKKRRSYLIFFLSLHLYVCCPLIVYLTSLSFSLSLSLCLSLGVIQLGISSCLTAGVCLRRGREV